VPPARLGHPLFTVHVVPRDGVLRLYRIVRKDDVDRGLERAFTPNHARGLGPRGPELVSTLIHRGLSMYTTVAGATTTARRFQQIGDHLAEVHLPPDAGINLAPTARDPEHVTVWGDTDTLVACVTRIIPIERS